MLKLMLRQILAILSFTIFSFSSFGQSAELDQLVSLDYRNVRLGDALDNISVKYRVNFSYSAHYVPIDQRIDLIVEEVPLTSALDELFEETEVVYTNIGDQVVLKKGKKPDRPVINKNGGARGDTSILQKGKNGKTGNAQPTTA